MKALVDLNGCVRQRERTARAIHAIAHPTRLAIVCFLMQGEQCVNDIVEAVGSSQSGVSQHLSILFERGMVVSRKEHNKVYYRVRDESVLQLVMMVQKVYCPQLYATTCALPGA